MKNFIIMVFLIFGTISCYNRYGFDETFDHCDNDPITFEKTYEHIDAGRACTMPGHDHQWNDVMTLEHIGNNIYNVKFFGLSIEAVREGCDFTIKEQSIELSGKEYKISGVGKHARRVDRDSGPTEDHLEFYISYENDGITTECNFGGTKDGIN